MELPNKNTCKALAEDLAALERLTVLEKDGVANSISRGQIALLMIRNAWETFDDLDFNKAINDLRSDRDAARAMGLNGAADHLHHIQQVMTLMRETDAKLNEMAGNWLKK